MIDRCLIVRGLRPRDRAAGEIGYHAIEKSDKSPSVPQLPQGFLLDVEFLSSEEEARYLERMAVLPFETVAMRGRTIRRQMLAFGVRFGTNFQSMVEAAPIPRELFALRGRAAEWAGTARGELTQALIQRYPRGATIGWHRDAERFGSPIVGISFGGPARMRFRNERGTVVAVTIPPRSIYLLSGVCRWRWQHAIGPVRELRYSITFRSVAASPSSPIS